MPEAPWQVIPYEGSHEEWVTWANRLPIAQDLGMRCEALSSERARFLLTDVPLTPNPNGAVNGGLLAALLDQAMGAAAFPHVADRHHVNTANLVVNYLRPARVPLTIEVEVTKTGRTLVFLDAQVRDGEGRLTTTSTGTMMVVPAP